MPMIEDGLKDHINERRPWERGINMVLLLINKDWMFAFNDFIKCNRFGKGSRANLINSLNILNLLDLPSNLKVRLSEIRESLLQTDEIFETDYVAGSGKVAELCRDVIVLFSTRIK